MSERNPLIKYSHETSVVILLILLIVIGVAYNFFKKDMIDYSICPLCEQSVIYHYKNETTTF